MRNRDLRTAQDGTRASRRCPTVRHDGPMDPAFDPKLLARAIVAVRDALHWSQPRLAEAAGISVTTIQRLELTAGGHARYPSRRSVFTNIERALRWPTGHCRAIGEGRVRVEDVVAQAAPVPSPAPPAVLSAAQGTAPGSVTEDEFVLDILRRPISREARDAIVDAYLAEKAKDDERRQREDEERRLRFLRIADLNTRPVK